MRWQPMSASSRLETRIKGHDSFLLDVPELFATVTGFLNSAAVQHGLKD